MKRVCSSNPDDPGTMTADEFRMAWGGDDELPVWHPPSEYQKLVGALLQARADAKRAARRSDVVARMALETGQWDKLDTQALVLSENSKSILAEQKVRTLEHLVAERQAASESACPRRKFFSNLKMIFHSLCSLWRKNK